MFFHLKSQRYFLLLSLMLCTLFFVSFNFNNLQVNALSLNGVDGIWQNAQRSPRLPAYNCVHYANTPDTSDENIITSAVGAFASGCPSQADVTSQSGLGFQGAQSIEFEPGEVFLLGEFTHYNNPIWFHDGNMGLVDLAVTLNFSDPAITTTLIFTVILEETVNEGVCLYPSVTPCADKVTFQNTIVGQEFELDSVIYTLQIIGFNRGHLETCEFDPDAEIINQFISDEYSSNSGCLFANIVVTEPALSIVKTGSSDPVTVGDTIDYEITVSNIGTQDLTGVTVVDSMLGLNQFIGNLAVGEQVVVIGDYQVTINDIALTSIVNTATADSNETESVSDSHLVPIQALADLTVIKLVNWSGIPINEAEFFEICVSGPSYPIVDCMTVGAQGGSITWEDLLPGAYIVSETFSGTNWTSILPDPNPVTVGSEDVTVYVQNVRRLGSLSVNKVVEWNGVTPDANQSFRICISGPTYPNGSCIALGSTGGSWLWDGLIPGDYVVSEDPLGAQWSVSGSGQVVTVLPANTTFATITNTFIPIADTCDSRDLRLDLTGLITNLNQGTVYNNGAEDCIYPIGMASYYMYDDIIDNQDIFDYITQTVLIPAGGTASLGIGIPPCRAQVDLFYGDVLISLNGQRYGDRLLDALITSDVDYCPAP